MPLAIEKWTKHAHTLDCEIHVEYVSCTWLGCEEFEMHRCFVGGNYSWCLFGWGYELMKIDIGAWSAND